MERIVAADIGGTNARFALAAIDGPRVVELGQPVMLRTADHPSFEDALATAFPARPPGLALAFAGPVNGDALRLTNSSWVLHRDQLDMDRVTIVNDFAAVAYAVATLGADHFDHMSGPDVSLPDGVISVIGPGTGLGAAILLRGQARYDVIETEGGHIGFAPDDAVDRQILDALQKRFGRVSVERVVSGPALRNIAEALGYDSEGRDDAALWSAALDGSDERLAEALERLCAAFGSAAGDLALAHGADAMIIAGGLASRLGARLATSAFVDRFSAKGRFAAHMNALPVKRLTHPQPGLYGAAAAFAREHC